MFKQFFSIAVLGNFASNAAAGISPKIVGGEFVTQGEYPWFTMFALLRNNGNFKETFGCGASLIDPEWVLTAAHCVYDTSQYYDEFGVVIGAFKPPYGGTNGGQTSEVIRVTKIVIHPDYR